MQPKRSRKPSIASRLCRYGVILLTVGLAVAGCSGWSDPAPTPIPTFTPSPTASGTASPSPSPFPTRTRTPEPTHTPTPTISPTATATVTPFPTLTAAVPFGNNLLYNLATWTAADAERLIELLEQYPPLRIGPDREDAFFQGFFYARIAQSEALMRFPEVIYAPFWRWDLAYNLARTRDPRAGGQYAFLLEKALERGTARLDNLDDWIQEIDPRLQARPLVLKPQPGYAGISLVEIRAGGSAVVLLAERESGDFVGVDLLTSFDFTRTPEFDFVIEDLTDDGVDEAVIYQRGSPERADPPLPRVYSLGEFPPVELAFQPGIEIPLDIAHKTLWRGGPGGPDGGDLQFVARMFPACPMTLSIDFDWTGSEFQERSRTYVLEPDADLLAFCDPALEHALGVWGPAPVLGLLEGDLIPYFGDGTRTELDPELADKWTLRQGIYQALVGRRVDAQATLTRLMESPLSDDPIWAERANAFLSAYGPADGLYAACQTTEFCDLTLALNAVVESLPPIGFELMIDRLVNAGILVRGSGRFDFNGDGTEERWFTVRHPGRLLLEFWIAYPGAQHLEALLVSTSDTSSPSLTLIETPPGLTVWQLNNQVPRRLLRRPDDGKFYIEAYSQRGLYAVERMQLAAETAREGLLKGEDPTQIRRDLLNLQDSPTFICPYYLCADFIYALALAHEFAGDERGAVDQYLELWRSYPSSPYTTIARLKLSGGALVPTATLTPTRTPRPTQTASPTGQPSPTPTPSPTETPTLTPDPYP